VTKLLLATNNNAKVSEYRRLLKGLPLVLVTLAEMGITAVVDEEGDSYEENARLKAVAYARASRMLTLADDSGLEVDALDGAPGKLSARYAGEAASDGDRVNYLLAKLEGVPWEQRTAHFKCVIALVVPAKDEAVDIEFYRGECHGFISFEPKGQYGFGYDPVFYLPEMGKTIAELTPAQKDRISHRGRAAREVYGKLKGLGLSL